MIEAKFGSQKKKKWVGKTVGEEWVSKAVAVDEDEILRGCRSTICNLQGMIRQGSRKNCQNGEPNLLSFFLCSNGIEKKVKRQRRREEKS